MIHQRYERIAPHANTVTKADFIDALDGIVEQIDVVVPVATKLDSCLVGRVNNGECDTLSALFDQSIEQLHAAIATRQQKIIALRSCRLSASTLASLSKSECDDDLREIIAHIDATSDTLALHTQAPREVITGMVLTLIHQQSDLREICERRTRTNRSARVA